jgi:dolichol-phosphate mannosyltransferase
MNAAPEVSVVIPVCNEEENVGPLAREIVAALDGRIFEILFIDDGSTDGTAAALRALQSDIPQLRILSHSFRAGQSAAVCTGVRHARAGWVATLDGAELVMGNRVQRRDTWLRHAQSRVANGVRGWLLGDGTPDTGCGIKVMHRETFMDLPRFDHMHRFLPALFLRAGKRVVSVPVKHRPRERGTSKYGLFDRLWVGIVDIFGVMWLRRRFKPGLTAREL